MANRPRVFISYRRKPESFIAKVESFAQRLYETGDVDVIFDEWAGDPDEGWPNWMRDGIAEADKVLLVFTPHYQRAYEGKERPDEGKGSTFEGIQITQGFYKPGAHNPKFRAVVLKGSE
ncbi:MAG: toll/interleukin-1 receptor domain-containing protein, partial [Roseimicrobium sp.]